MQKRKIISALMLSTIVLSQAAPVWATVQDELNAPKTELVEETPKPEDENHAEAPPTDEKVETEEIEENTEPQETPETLERIADANLTRITETTFTTDNTETSETIMPLESEIEGTWGDVSYSFNTDNGELTISGGSLPASNIYNNFGTLSPDFHRTDIKSIVFDGKVTANANSSYLFYYLPNLTNIEGLEDNFDTSNVTNMTSMFDYARNLTALDLSDWNTSNVTDMHSMFQYATRLTALDLSDWNTSNVTDMHSMFDYAISLTKLNMSGWDTGSVTDMHSMFYYARNLTALDLSDWDTSNVTDMGFMFYNTHSLTALDLKNFDTSEVQNMQNMFSGARSLTELDLSKFDTSQVTDMSNMFSGTSSLTKLDLSSFDTGAVISNTNMLHDTYSLNTIKLGANTNISGTSLPTSISTRLDYWELQESETLRSLTSSELMEASAESDNVTGTWIRPKFPQTIRVNSFEVSATATTLMVSEVETSEELDEGFKLEYGITTDSSGDGIVWQDEPEFTKLKTNTQYYVYVRVAENQNHSAGESLENIANTAKGVTAEETELVYAGRTQDVAEMFDFADGLTLADYELRLLSDDGELEGSSLKFETVGTFEIGAYAKHNDELEATLILTITPRPVTFTGTVSLTRPFDGTDFFGVVDGLTNYTFTAENLDSFENVVEGDNLRLYANATVSGKNAAGSNASSDWSHLIFDENQEWASYMLIDEQTDMGAENYILQEEPVFRTMITQATRDDQFELNLEVESFSHNHVTLTHTLDNFGLIQQFMTPINFMSLTRAEVDDTPRVEYAYSATNSITDVTWQTSPTFTGLQPNTTYHFFARVAETNNFLATAHEVLSLRTSALGNVTVPKEIEDGNGESGNEQNFTTGAENVADPKNLPSTGDVLEPLFGFLGTGVLVGLLTWLRQRKN
ncbi:BspA family leucine-rich repeat surface protein [Lactococcus allomyrinae]|uniref:BspA family leucine-rich repeat surface protein n=1 Tax=Lactococcus allomyrinae TaxID=2419773 RepID=A0A387B859_9LACT|nr:BspA family leucine-rich repeat surface protein [Lactococcus allomyrinae]AYF99994.1 BspA family leucine-rich repeat surface protein [Lactococcus allomyrinae]